jgi:hypothetical protein
MDQWLVRTASNRIDGPFPREQVIEMIRDGKLGLQDEICQANQYWIYLHEHQEVQRQLGIQMPRNARNPGERGEEEITETQTETETDVATPVASDSPVVLPVLEDYAGGTTISRKPISQRPKLDAAPRMSVSVAGTSVPRTPLERSSVWRVVAWIMALAALAIVISVLRLLKNAG